jgi:nitrite reductase/ring-hydroxylating ferredoxin subunit
VGGKAAGVHIRDGSMQLGASLGALGEHGRNCGGGRGKCLALVNLKGEIFALEDIHEAGPLSEGHIIGENIECP